MANESAGKTESEAPTPTKDAPKPVFSEETPVETIQELLIGDRTLRYKVTVGRLPLKNHSQDKPEIEAQVFYTYYALESDKKKKKGQPEAPASSRPLTFAFNGGPGSASVWLHLGALGPQRVVLRPDGSLPPPPYRLEPNPQTWLTETGPCFYRPGWHRL